MKAKFFLGTVLHAQKPSCQQLVSIWLPEQVEESVCRQDYILVNADAGEQDLSYGQLIKHLGVNIALGNFNFDQHVARFLLGLLNHLMGYHRLRGVLSTTREPQVSE